MIIPFIDLKTQYQALKTEIDDRIQRVLDHGQYILGPEVKELEDKLADYIGAKYCITVASGTEALLISLMALGIKLGDEVITTPFTFISAAEAIVLLGATPVFVDIEPNTCNINAKLIEEAITSKTKAIIPVSLYGQTADMDEINMIGVKHNLPVIEDAAQSFGAEYKGKKSCNLSTVGCTSFFPSKPLGCYGDGGAIFTSDEKLAQACREIRIHGQSKRYLHTRIGVGGRMDTLQCAIVLAKLERYDWEIKARKTVAAKYDSLLTESIRNENKYGSRKNCLIKKLGVCVDRTSVYAQYTLLSEDRDALQKYLTDVGVPTSVHYPLPINEQPAYKKLSRSNNTPIASQYSKQVFSIPMGSYLSDEQIKFVMKKIFEFNK